MINTTGLKNCVIVRSTLVLVNPIIGYQTQYWGSHWIKAIPLLGLVSFPQCWDGQLTVKFEENAHYSLDLSLASNLDRIELYLPEKFFPDHV